MLAQNERKRQAERIIGRAVEQYGPQKNRQPRPALEQLIISIFGRLTSVSQSTRALRRLKRSFVDWNEVRVSHAAELARVLPATRWAKVGSHQVVWLLHALYERYSRVDLEFLKDFTGPQARSCLQTLPTVNRAVADAVLLLSRELRVLPFSPAVARMCYRLGMIEDDRPSLTNQRAASSLLDPQYLASVHYLFADSAGKYCLSDGPVCDQCPVADLCPPAEK